MTNITSKLSKIKDLSKGSKNEEAIKEACEELESEVKPKSGKAYGDPIVELM